MLSVSRRIFDRLGATCRVLKYHVFVLHTATYGSDTLCMYVTFVLLFFYRGVGFVCWEEQQARLFMRGLGWLVVLCG